MNLNAGCAFETNSKEIQSFSDTLNIEIVTNFKDFKKFYNFPFQLYKDNPYWVSPYWKELKDFFLKKNPF